MHSHQGGLNTLSYEGFPLDATRLEHMAEFGGTARLQQLRRTILSLADRHTTNEAKGRADDWRKFAERSLTDGKKEAFAYIGNTPLHQDAHRCQGHSVGRSRGDTADSH